MKADKKTLFSIFIVLLFVGSLFAIMTYGGGRNTNPNTDINGIPDTNTEPVNYQAQFDANISEIFPQMIVAGRPIEYDQAGIENSLLELQGIKNKTLSFRQAADGNINLIITISYMPDKKEEIISQIKEMAIIEEPIEFYQQALLDIPEDVNFTNDSNQTVSYYFGETPMEGVVNIESLKGDSINVACYASFSGNELISATGIETYNNSSSPQMLVSSGDFNVVGYDNKIYTSVTFDFNDIQDGVTFENKLKKEFPNIKITTEMTKPLIFSTTDQNKDEITLTFDNIKQNIKDNIVQIGSAKDYNHLFNLEFDENTASVYFENDLNQNFHNYLLNGALFTLKYMDGGGPEIIQRPEITVNLELDINEVDKEKLAEIVNKRPEDLNLKIFATIDTSNLVIEGKNYQYEKTTTQASVNYPEDLNKTTLTLSIQAYAQRDKILYLGLMK